MTDLDFYCWRVPTQIDGEERLLIPWSDPNVYEQSFNFVFDTVEAAVNALEEWDATADAVADDWMLVRYVGETISYAMQEIGPFSVRLREQLLAGIAGPTTIQPRKAPMTTDPTPDEIRDHPLYKLIEAVTHWLDDGIRKGFDLPPRPDNEPWSGGGHDGRNLPNDSVLASFFESEVNDYRENVRNGNIDPTDGFHPTLASAVDSLQQAPSDIAAEWLGVDFDDDTDDLGVFDETLRVMLELTNLILQHGPNALLVDFI